MKKYTKKRKLRKRNKQRTRKKIRKGTLKGGGWLNNFFDPSKKYGLKDLGIS